MFSHAAPVSASPDDYAERDWQATKSRVLERGFEPSDRALLGAVKALTGCSAYADVSTPSYRCAVCRGEEPQYE